MSSLPNEARWHVYIYNSTSSFHFGQMDYSERPNCSRKRSATSSFQVFGDLYDRSTLVYLDDLLVYSEGIEGHLKSLETVLQRCRTHKLFIKRSKCMFANLESLFAATSFQNKVSVLILQRQQCWRNSLCETSKNFNPSSVWWIGLGTSSQTMRMPNDLNLRVTK